MDASDGMREFLRYHGRILVFMSAVCLAAAVALLVAVPGDAAWAGGFVAGAAAQLFKFGVLDVAAIRKIAVRPESAAATQVKSMYVSMLVFGLAAAAVFMLKLNVWTMAAGIFAPRLILLADSYIRPNPFGTAGNEPE